MKPLLPTSLSSRSSRKREAGHTVVEYAVVLDETTIDVTATFVILSGGASSVAR